MNSHLKTHSGEKPNKYNQFDPTYFCSDTSRSHFKAHNGVTPPQLSSAMQVEGKPFQCDLCTASFVSKHGLKYHTESTHPMASKQSSSMSTFPHTYPAMIQNTAPNIFPWDQCAVSFSTETSLKIHMEEVHTPPNITYKSGMAFQHLIPDNWG